MIVTLEDITEPMVDYLSESDYNDCSSFTFYIKGVSRALLQELVRHNSSPTVKSSRFTLNELRGRQPFNLETAKEFVVLTGHPTVDAGIVDSLNTLLHLVNSGISNDVTKYAIPEAYKTSLDFTITYNGLANLIRLRANKSALKEIRVLAREMFDLLPVRFRGSIMNDKLKKDLEECNSLVIGVYDDKKKDAK